MTISDAIRILTEHEKQRVCSLNGWSNARRTVERSATIRDFAPLFSSVQFCLIAELDIFTLNWQMLTSHCDWQRKLNARLLAMTLYEYVNTFPTVLGTEFRVIVKVVCKNDSSFGQLKTILKRLDSFRRRHERFLQEIRNSTAAHRETDADLFIAVLDNIDPTTLKVLSKEFIKELDEFLKLMTRILAVLNATIRPKT